MSVTAELLHEFCRSATFLVLLVKLVLLNLMGLSIHLPIVFVSCFGNIALGVGVPDLDNNQTDFLSQTDHYVCCPKLLLGISISNYQDNDSGNKTACSRHRDGKGSEKGDRG